MFLLYSMFMQKKRTLNSIYYDSLFYFIYVACLDQRQIESKLFIADGY